MQRTTIGSWSLRNWRARRAPNEEEYTEGMEMAPEFALPDQDGKLQALAD